MDDMERFGAPINFNVQRPESLLIRCAAKQPGRQAQKRHDGVKFELQSAQRLSYSFMIDSMYTSIWEPIEITDSHQSTNASGTCLDNGVDIQESTGHATFGTLWIDEQLQYQLVWKTSTHKDLMQLPLVLMQFICN